MTKGQTRHGLAESPVQRKEPALGLKPTRRDFELAVSRDDKSWLKSLLRRWELPQGGRLQ